MDLSPLWVSIKTSLVATVITFFLGLAAAQGMLRYRGRGRAVIDGVLALPLVLPPTVIGFFLLLLFGRRSMIGHALEQIGLTVAFSWPATVVAATVVAFPLMYRTALGAFEQVNPTFLHAARTLGASEWRVFHRVLLPLAAPGVIAGTVLAFARALGEFGATLMLAGNIPGRTQTMPVAVFFAAEGGDMNRALAWVLLLVAVSLAMITLLNYRAGRRVIRGRRAIYKEPLQTPPIALTRHQSQRSAGELTIDVEKRLESFTLQVSLSTTGGTLGVLGASGSGKSMTLRCLAGVETPDRGRITINGRVVFDSSAGINLQPALRRIGVVFQDYALFPHMTVAENIRFGLVDLPVSERDRRVFEMLTATHLQEFANRFPTELSGGQRQRVALGRALAIEPEALLLDEPFSALDQHLRRQMEEELRETLSVYPGPVLFVTHDLNEAFRISTELLVMEDGRPVGFGSKDSLFTDPRMLAVARLTGCKNLAEASRTHDGLVRIELWGVTLQAAAEEPLSFSHAGIRAHHLSFPSDGEGENCFPCWLVDISESPFEVTLYLHLHREPREGDHPQLEADLPKDQWEMLSKRPQPWCVRIPAERLLLLQGWSPETKREEAAPR